MLDAQNDIQQEEVPEQLENTAPEEFVEGPVGDEGHEDVDGGEVDEATAQSEDTPEYMKQHFRRLEKKLKKENRELNEKLAVTNHQLNQYGELFQSTYANAYQPGQAQDVEPQDEVEAKVLDIIKRRDNETYKQQMMRAQQQEEQTILGALKANLDKGSESYDDFDDVVHDKNLPLTKDIAIATTYLPNGADVLYALAKNPDELHRINAITNTQAKMLALSTYAFNLQRGNKVTTSSAPKPMSNPQLKDKPSVKPDVSRMTYEQLKAARKAQTQQATRKR